MDTRTLNGVGSREASSARVTSQSATTKAIETTKLTKVYGKHRGVNDLDLIINQGEVFGFLGPNGAGKTTTIRMLMGMIKPTGGSAQINGLDIVRDSVEIRRQVGYLPGEFSLYPNLTGAKTLQYFANLRGMNQKEAWEYITKMADRLELDLNKKFKQYSRGNKQKLGIIQAFMHKPSLLILDEPSGGLDPLNQQEFYKLVDEAKAEGATVFFSSHILSEVEKVCDRVGIIREGLLVKVGGVSEIINIKTHHIEFTFANSVPVEVFKPLPGVQEVTALENNILLVTVRPEGVDPTIKTASQYSLLNMVSREPSLEEIFLNYYK
jgi:ABC-2 type transport system ATP-binding protein